MISKKRMKQFKWMAIAGSLVNIAINVLFLVYICISIGRLEEVLSTSFYSDIHIQLYRCYYFLANFITVDLVFSLLIISASFRINQIFYRLKWANILTTIFSIAIVVLLAVFSNRFQEAGGHYVVSIQSWVIYVLLGIGLALMLADDVILYFKFKNNPFYHNGKFRKTNARSNYRSRPEDDVIDVNEKQNTVNQENLSYFEIYEKRSQELREVEDLFDQGKINEAEYSKRRKEIYEKYDRYN